MAEASIPPCRQFSSQFSLASPLYSLPSSVLDRFAHALLITFGTAAHQILSQLNGVHYHPSKHQMSLATTTLQRGSRLHLGGLIVAISPPSSNALAPKSASRTLFQVTVTHLNEKFNPTSWSLGLVASSWPIPEWSASFRRRAKYHMIHNISLLKSLCYCVTQLNVSRPFSLFLLKLIFCDSCFNSSCPIQPGAHFSSLLWIFIKSHNLHPFHTWTFMFCLLDGERKIEWNQCPWELSSYYPLIIFITWI